MLEENQPEKNKENIVNHNKFSQPHNNENDLSSNARINKSSNLPKKEQDIIPKNSTFSYGNSEKINPDAEPNSFFSSDKIISSNSPNNGGQNINNNNSSDGYFGKVDKLNFNFIGEGAEYFKIWIVNTCLTILTLGIYYPWALVRKRQYLYKSTQLDGNSFTYTARAIDLFKGYLIVGTSYIIFAILANFIPIIGVILVIIYSIIIPWLIYKSIRFKTKNTVYRSIRLGFRGKLAESYLVYLIYTLLIPLTLGLIIPFQKHQAKKYLFNNLMIGQDASRFEGKVSKFYLYVLIYLIPFFVIFGIAIIASIAFPIYAKITSKIPGPFINFANQNFDNLLILIIPIYLFAVLFFVLIRNTYDIVVHNYTFNTTSFGGQKQMTFSSNVKVWKYLWIVFANALLIIFTLGLAYPWTIIRKLKYKINNLETNVERHWFDTILQAKHDKDSSIGEMGDELLDFDIGF